MKVDTNRSLTARAIFQAQSTALACITLAVAACGGSGNPAQEPEGGAAAGGSAGSSGAGDVGGNSSAGSGAGASPQGGTGGVNMLPGFGGANHDPPVPCPTDASKLGVWENAEPNEFHMPSNMQTVAVGVNPIQGSVYAAASNKTNGGNGSTGIYKSMDCGATWKLQSTGASADKLRTGQLWAMMVDPEEPNNLYVANGYGDGPTLYKSPNDGVDWIPLKPDTDDALNLKSNFVQCVSMDPGNPKHIAVTFHDDCVKNYNKLCLSRSLDGGANWQMFNGPDIGGWQEAATMSIVGPTHYFYMSGAGAWFTPDLGKTWTKVIDAGYFARYQGSITIAPDGTAYTAGAAKGVFSSTATANAPLGAVWTLVENSPVVATIIHDGANLIGAHVNGPPFFTAKLSDPTVWTHMETPTITAGSNGMAFDPIHNVVYSANFENGLYRMLTKLP